ncbi:MAG: oxygenase MpaB family protein [Mycobacteriaceae bacterium]
MLKDATRAPIDAGQSLCPVHEEENITVPLPLGADSLTWRYFGDWRGMLQGVWAGSMQNMHPQLGAAVEQHSQFFAERWERLLRSTYPISGVVFDGNRAQATAEEVRGYHTNIKGVDSQGRRYHALNPETFYWAHATFFMSNILLAQYFAGGITEDQKRQLFDEHIQWYRLYGMSMKPVPKTWEDFQIYWNHMCCNVLEDNKAAREVLDLSTLPVPPFAEFIPEWLWNQIHKPIAHFQVWVTVGLYDQPIRDLLGYTWGPRDTQLLTIFGKVVNLVFSALPEKYRLHPRAKAGFDRAAGRISPDTPLVHTPARYLPPVEERSNPMHYCPKV